MRAGREPRGVHGDDDLLTALHEAHAEALWSFVVSLTGDREAAQDVVQETLLRAWRNPGVLDPRRGDPRSWLFTVARRIVIDDWRRRRSRPETLTDLVPDSPRREQADETDRLLETWVITEALATLSADHRAVLVECYYRGRSVAEAAAALGIPAGTVKSRSHYALMNLRLALQEKGLGR